MSASDDADNLDLPAVEPDAISTGAAADSADWEERLKGLPRLLRYAMLVSDNAGHVEPRLIAEINELCPNLPLNAAWAAALTVDAGLALAAELDRRAATENDPNLRSVADCVRLLSLPMPRGAAFFEEHRRVAKALLLAFNKIVRDSEEQLCSDVERFAFGWAALPACSHMMVRHESAAVNAVLLGARMAEHRIAAMQAAARRAQEEERRVREEAEKEATEISYHISPTAEVVPDHHLVIARLSSEEMKNVKLKEILGPLKSVINVPLPLVEVPPLHQVRSTLQFEFPYATDVIDFALADLVGRTTVRLKPLLLVGDPGGGKTRFARRLGEVLGLNVWREDASRADGAVFGGTDRRWHSAQPCHPFSLLPKAKSPTRLS
jgi:ATP-dependent Lon protease